MTAAVDAAGVRVVVDDDAYGAAAAAFSQKFLGNLVRELARNDLIALESDERTINLVFDIAFQLFGTIEDHGGVDAGGVGVAHLAFAGCAVEPERLVVSWRRTFLHGDSLDDPLIVSAIETVRAEQR